MLVKEIMNKQVVTAEADTRLRDVMKLMADNHIGSVIIVKNKKPVGIITDRDVLLCLAEDLESADTKTAGDVMARWLITIGPESTVEKAATAMLENDIKKLPVMENDKLVGIITTSDIVAAEPKMVRDLSAIIRRKAK